METKIISIAFISALAAVVTLCITLANILVYA